MPLSTWLNCSCNFTGAVARRSMSSTGWSAALQGVPHSAMRKSRRVVRVNFDTMSSNTLDGSSSSCVVKGPVGARWAKGEVGCLHGSAWGRQGSERHVVWLLHGEMPKLPHK